MRDHTRKRIDLTLGRTVRAMMLVGVLAAGCENGLLGQAGQEPEEIAETSGALSAKPAPAPPPAAPAGPTRAELKDMRARIDAKKAELVRRSSEGAADTELKSLGASLAELSMKESAASAIADSPAGVAVAAAVAAAAAPAAAAARRQPSQANVDAYLELARKHDRSSNEAAVALHAAKLQLLGDQ